MKGMQPIKKMESKGSAMKKPTMQDIADALSTSRVTVWKALNGRPGVSDALREEIRNKAQQMGYFAAEAEPPRRQTVAAVVSRPESSAFWIEIIHQLAKELSDRNINLLYTYLPAVYEKGYTLPAALRDGSVSGLLVLNVYSEQLLRMLAGLPLPKVFLDTMPAVPFGQLDGNLVMLEGRCLVREITGRLLRSGRTRLGFIGDIRYAQTNMDRYEGFLDAHREAGLMPDPALSLTGPLGLYTHHAEIGDFLRGLNSLPDGFVCASDYIAHFVQANFTEHELDPGQRVVLTGFDNNAEYTNVAGRITTVDVQTETLGARLANDLLFVTTHPEASKELIYVNSEILYRGSWLQTSSCNKLNQKTNLL